MFLLFCLLFAIANRFKGSFQTLNELGKTDVHNRQILPQNQYVRQTFSTFIIGDTTLRNAQALR